MNSTRRICGSRTPVRIGTGALGLAGWLLVLALGFSWARALAADDPMPRPPQLERDVQFWIRVYTQIDTNAGFLHDQSNLGIVYETLHFAPDSPPSERQRLVDQARERVASALRRIAGSGDAPLSAEDQRIHDLWGGEGTPARLRAAVDDIRFQLGQSDRFRSGLIRSGAWETHIAETLANLGLPAELAVLPHVESSFNPGAYSKVGAAGLWQFMRSTGRRYMRIDGAVDDRLDPFRSTEAAAQLLAYNYRVLGTWPLALTAYNHGTAGVRRAKETLGTDDIVRIVRSYSSRTFGFASRNFYVSFLAALEIDRNPEKYFGPLQKENEAHFQEVELPAYVSASSLEHVLKIEAGTLRSLNPALLPAVWNGAQRVPKAYRLRLPVDGSPWSSQLLAQRLTPGEMFAGQRAPPHYRVQRGDTLAALASRYGVPIESLAELNHLRTSAHLRPGRVLTVPETTSITLAAAAASPGSVPSVTSAPVSTPLAPAPAAAVPRSSAAPAPAPPPAVSPAPPPLLAARAPVQAAAPSAPAADAVAPPSPGGAVSAEDAVRESAEDAAAGAALMAASTKPHAASAPQPVSAAQAEALGPALGPAADAEQSADPIDYSVAQDDTIRVAAEETLGHYADWLGVTSARLREINHLKFRSPVLIGQRIRLDFSRVTREVFETLRHEYHRELQAAYFASHRIVGTEVRIARSGDSGWTLSQRRAQLPLWLLQQYNPDLDLTSLRAGTQIVMPRVEEIASGG
ncbi:MAG TPA: transglycosylase SLT domain-containing protein [Steroidobacteraceae bacterium]|jgi:membrane-bound lytic murein transglycosylase D|nr:transglycosylase SLT domain-containing protein [Steroidobacteraceae bacterium]